MPDTGETGFGFWPTANVPNGGRVMKEEDALAKGKTANGKRQVGLQDAVKFWPMPTKQDGANNAGPAQMARKTPPLKVEAAAGSSGQLNPNWVEWLMGYPIGHTALKDSATPSSRKSRK